MAPGRAARRTLRTHMSQLGNYSGLAAFSIVFTAVPVIFYIVISKRNGGESLFAGAIRG